MTRDANGRSSDEAPPELHGVFPQPGAVFDGKYRIERVIGRGAMAVVLEATHLQLQDRVAIKLLLPEWAENAEVVERFMREGRAATRIRSEHVVRVFDVGVVDAHPYLVMEYLHGRDLDQVLVEEGPLPVTLAIDYLLQACEAIAEAHVHGVIHRDLKPANLFLTRRADDSACVKVLDFGISKATESVALDTRTTAPSTVMGSPHYMSPEQMVSSKDVDARSDVWALGAILHELLTGSPPFEGETFAALSAAVLRDPAPHLTTLRADVPPEVEAAVLRCLEKEPARRFANVAELAAELAKVGSPAAHASAARIARVLDGGTGKISVPAPRLSEAPRARAVALVGRASMPPVRTKGRVAGYVVAGVTLVAIGSWVASMVMRDERALRAAESQGGAPDAGGVVRTTAASAAALVPSASAEPAPSTAASVSPSARASAVTATPPATTAAPPRPAMHPRAPRRAPRPPRIPPLPDFPVPSDDPPGEPASRPVLPTLPATPAPAPASAAPAVPTGSAPSP
jgi:serine/threonine-protein kinase